MRDLIKLLPEQYQDIEYRGKLYRGKRNCSLRWEVIKNHIKDGDVVMDLGSSLGYFSHKIAKEYPNSLVISFESEPEMCAIQRKIFKSEGIYNVIVCQYRLGRVDLEKWVKYVDCLNTILALSILHHFPSDDVQNVFSRLLELSESMIGEVPAGNEKEMACGKSSTNIVESILRTRGHLTLGYVPSHLGNYDRRIWRIFSPHKCRPNLDGYFGVSHEGRHKFDLRFGKLNDRLIIKGLNVWNLLHFNIVWPPPNWWKVQARAAYECLEFKSDVRPWNLLVTSTGLKAIDHTYIYPEGDQAEFKPEHLNRLDELFAEMRPDERYLGTWK